MWRRDVKQHVLVVVDDVTRVVHPAREELAVEREVDEAHAAGPVHQPRDHHAVGKAAARYHGTHVVLQQ